MSGGPSAHPSAHPSATGLLLLALLAASILLHAVGAMSQRALDTVFLCSLAWPLFKLAGKAGTGRVVAGLAAVGIPAILAGIQLWRPSLQYTPYLAIAPANLALAWIFARGLLPGHRPVLLRIVVAMGQAPADDPGFLRFIAGQCLLWSAMTFSTAMLALASMIHAPSRPWLPAALGIVIVVQIVWFAASHHYASRRYGRPETWRDTLRTMLRPALWANPGT